MPCLTTTIGLGKFKANGASRLVAVRSSMYYKHNKLYITGGTKLQITSVQTRNNIKKKGDCLAQINQE